MTNITQIRNNSQTQFFAKQLAQIVDLHNQADPELDTSYDTGIDNMDEFEEFADYCVKHAYYPEFAFQGLLGSTNIYVYL